MYNLSGGFIVFLCSLGLLMVAGCVKKGGGAAHSPEEVQIRNAAVLYGQYLAKHQGRPPADLATLKKWAESLPKADLHNLYGSENPDLSKAFTSPRDGQEYVLRKSSGGVPGGGDGAGRVLLYERTGDSQGKRFVAFETGQVEEVDAEKFKKLVPEAK